MKKILVFGNPLVEEDRGPLKLIKDLNKKFDNLQFEHVDALEDLEKYGKNLIILDTVMGVESPKIFELKKENYDKLVLPPSYGMHDFDLAYNLKLLLKIGKIEGARIVCVPEKISVDKLEKVLEKI